MEGNAGLRLAAMLLNYFLTHGEPIFTSDDAIAAWHWITRTQKARNVILPCPPMSHAGCPQQTTTPPRSTTGWRRDTSLAFLLDDRGQDPATAAANHPVIVLGCVMAVPTQTACAPRRMTAAA